ncbi:hypothetical protein AK88_01772 [Plasmodium fragile]|uniref:Uncharacterized protein n=1 Tax=Plasmodium fragile TaxID=5857 RepID=A0A0D9QNH6_PLAFR|nr:uncharacterized protein AK88_01772 [Plasmodium fragile]KJP88493.1 hypothetical protein AK88_01772 [Plasmodium fragile]
MKNDNAVVYKNNTWSIYNNKPNAPGNKKKSRVEYLTQLGKGQLFDEAANENESKQSEVTDMYIYTGKGVEKVSINTATTEKKNEINKNKRYQYLKDKITNALKNQEKIKQNTNENEFPSASENDPTDVFIFDKLKNEINILNSKGLNEEEYKKGTYDPTVDSHPVEGSSFPHTDGRTTEDIFPGADVHVEATSFVTSNNVGEDFGYVRDDVGIPPDQGGYHHEDENREDEEPLYKKDERELAIQSEDHTHIDDDKRGTPNEAEPKEEASIKPNGEFFIYTEKCSDISSESDDEIYSESEVDPPKWESQPERGNFMSRLDNQTRDIKNRANFQRENFVKKCKNGTQAVYKRGVYEGGSPQRQSLQRGWYEKGLYENSWSEESQGEYSSYKDPPRKHVANAHPREELHSVQKQMHQLNMQINNVKDKMNIINTKKNGIINVLNKKINILKNKLSDNYVNNINDDINIVNSQIDILFIKKINKMYKQVDSYVKNINDQIGKNLSTHRTLEDNIDSALYSHIQRQISNIKVQVRNLHDQLNSHMYQQKSNKMFNQMNSQINNTNNQIGRHLDGQLHSERGGLPGMDLKRIIPNEHWNHERNSKGSLTVEEEEDLSFASYEKKMHNKRRILTEQDYLYRGNPFCKNTDQDLYPQINFSNADEGSDAYEDQNYYSRVSKHHNGGAFNVGEYVIEGESFVSDASAAKYGTHRGKITRGGSKGYNSSDSCRSRNSKRRKTRNDNEPNYDHLKRKNKLINLFNRNMEWETNKFGDGMDKVKAQSEINADGVRRRSAFETDDHTGLRFDEYAFGGQTVNYTNGDSLMHDEGPWAKFGHESGQVGTVEAVEVIDVDEVIQAARVVEVPDVIEVTDVTNVVDPTKPEEPPDKRADAGEVYNPFSDQKLMYLKKKLMQMDLFKKNQKRKNEEDGINHGDLKTDASEQANEMEKRMVPMEVANGLHEEVEFVSHTEKGDTLQNGPQSTCKTGRFMFVEERQATVVGGSTGDAYVSYNAKDHWKRPASQNDRSREIYPNGDRNSANESKDFVSMFHKLVPTEGKNGQSEHKGQNNVPHYCGNIGEDKVADNFCLSEKSTFLHDGDQRNVDPGGDNVDMFRHFFFLKDEMKGSENVEDMNSMDNTSNDQNEVENNWNRWKEQSIYPSASETTYDNCGHRKNAQLTNSFTIDQICDYTVDYYHQMSESKEAANGPNTNVSGVLNGNNQMNS